MFFCIIGCGDTPIFTEMKTSRLKIVLKGTYETEGISQFVNMNSLSANNAAVEDSINSYDSVDDVTSPSEDTLPTSFMLDIAEIKLDGKKISNYRQVHEFSLAGDGSSIPFFNGSGVELKNDDPSDGTYDKVKIYVRKMVFDNAMVYESDGNTMSYDDAATVIFHEDERNGFDFNQLQVESYWDTLRLEGGEELRNFPLVIPINGGLKYDKDNDETILEVRLVIKNFIKKYEYDYYNSGIYKVCHYYAPSDWLRDIRAGEKYIGRNLQAVARSYVVGETGVISGVSSANRYIIAIPAGENINDYTVDSALRIARGGNCDLPQPPSYPGSYIEAILDYYLKYENYKTDWKTKAGLCGTTTDYESAWDNYETAVEKFKIPPYVVFSNGSGNYAFNNVNPGSYDVYRASVSLSYGELFTDGQFVLIGNVSSLLAGETRSPL